MKDNKKYSNYGELSNPPVMGENEDWDDNHYNNQAYYKNNWGYQQQYANYPMGPPPRFIPEQGVNLYAITPSSISNCLHRHTYIWPIFGKGYWMFPTKVYRDTVTGYKWNGYKWLYFGTTLNSIQSFDCYR